MFPPFFDPHNPFHVEAVPTNVTTTDKPANSPEQDNERRPDPQRNPRSQSLLPDAGAKPDSRRPRTSPVPPGHQRRERCADRPAEPGSDDEDRLWQHPPLQVPHGRRPGLGSPDQPRQGRQRHDDPPARQHPDGRPPPRSGLTTNRSP